MTTLDRPTWKHYPHIEVFVVAFIFISAGAFAMAALGGIAGAHLAPFWYPNAAQFAAGRTNSIETETFNAYRLLPTALSLCGAFIGGLFGAALAYALRRHTPGR